MPSIITGATVEVSARTFYDWIFAQLCNNTPLHVEENGVRLKIANNRVMYVNNAFQKLWHPRRKQGDGLTTNQAYEWNVQYGVCR